MGDNNVIEIIGILEIIVIIEIRKVIEILATIGIIEIIQFLLEDNPKPIETKRGKRYG